MRRTFHLVVVALVLFVGVPAHGDGDAGDEARARSLYERGMAHFQLDEFDAAIALWLEAYRWKPASELLYNVAQAHRLKSERALAFYRKYLALNPHAANRAEAERHIETLERLLSEEPPKIPAAAVVAKPAPPPSATLPKPIATPSPPITTPLKPMPPKPVKLAPTVVQSGPSVLVERAPAKSVFKKPWLWATVGTVALVVGVGVGLGVGVKPAGGDPNASFGIARGN